MEIGKAAAPTIVITSPSASIFASNYHGNRTNKFGEQIAEITVVQSLHTPPRLQEALPEGQQGG